MTTQKKTIELLKGKNRVSFIDPSALLRIAEVMTAGSAKHGPYSAATDPRTSSDHIEATMRHLLVHNSGDLIDPEFGKSHLDHAAARLIMAIAVRERELKNGGNEPSPKRRGSGVDQEGKASGIPRYPELGFGHVYEFQQDAIPPRFERIV